MSGTSSAEIYHALAALPREALTLLDQAPGIFASRTWWQVVQDHAIPQGSRPLFVAIRSAGRIVAVFPMLQTGGNQIPARSEAAPVSLSSWPGLSGPPPQAPDSTASPDNPNQNGQITRPTSIVRRATISSLTTPYTCEYFPLFAHALPKAERLTTLAAFGQFCRKAGVVRIDALPPNDWHDLRATGLTTVRFNHFGNWFEDVQGLDWPTYLATRTGALRETIKRRLRRAGKLPDARFDIFTEPKEDIFETVYQRSWKEPEPFPTFNAALMRGMATQGLLRLGVWSIGAQPVAVQFWVVRDGHATVLKLAHDEAFKTHSPGTVLTAMMLQHLLDQEHVTRIDFGRGDDDYKQGWAKSRRQMTGVLLINPWRPSGIAALARHAAGRIRARLTRRAP